VPQANLPDCEFPYRPRWGIILACAAFFTAGGFVLRSAALSNDRGLTIEHLITLSPENATIFYWVLCVVSFGFVLLALVLSVLRILNPQKLAFSADGLFAPKRPWSAHAGFIPYNTIVSVSTTQVGRHEFLNIIHSAGKQNISASMLDSPLAFEDVCEELERRLKAAGRSAMA
jgi:hypothetical protein